MRGEAVRHQRHGVINRAVLHLAHGDRCAGLHLQTVIRIQDVAADPLRRCLMRADEVRAVIVVGQGEFRRIADDFQRDVDSPRLQIFALFGGGQNALNINSVRLVEQQRSSAPMSDIALIPAMMPVEFHRVP